MSQTPTRITDEQITEIAIPYGIMLGDSGTDVATRIRKLDLARAAKGSATEAS